MTTNGAMTANGIAQIVVFLVVLLVLVKPLGAYMARVYEGHRVALDRVLGWLERDRKSVV